ncbi:ribose-phosphate diphosphokinase [Leucothrix arctica]|uniref:Ribose-phosphate pyrophosphokinase n=1 Tax=Leucothrix arctica TaxID=1481894 RepID=A0A317CJ09_9GAMM|nr:ribose-phosphate diphosphokinase [Leucothrix arctica]PWQ98548.1 ribose-phosphate pyrophosphokinase [Leucothrix arctica]
MTITVTNNQNDNIDISVISFSGGERHVQLGNIDSLAATSLNVTARINSATGIMDLLLVVNALRHRFGTEVAIDVTIPYLPYARQDRVCAAGQAFSLEVFAAVLATMPVRSITTWDCHSTVGIELTGAINVMPEKIIASSPALVEVLTADNSVLICPDEGAKARCEAIKTELNISDSVQCYKKRDPSTGKVLCTEVNIDSLAGKTAIITDDICDGGYTFIKIAEQLKAKGADKVILYVTHGIFSKGLDVFDGLIDEIYTTDSFEREATDPRINQIKFA